MGFFRNLQANRRNLFPGKTAYEQLRRIDEDPWRRLTLAVPLRVLASALNFFRSISRYAPRNSYALQGGARPNRFVRRFR